MMTTSRAGKLKMVILLWIMAGLFSCRAPGTDSGNPEMNTGFTDDTDSPDWHRGNPLVKVVDEGFCSNFQRCASVLSGSDCRRRVLNSKGMSEFFQIPVAVDLALIEAIERQQVRFDQNKVSSCLTAFGQPEFCRAIEVKTGAARASSDSPIDVERMTMAVKQALQANSACWGLLTNP